MFVFFFTGSMSFGATKERWMESQQVFHAARWEREFAFCLQLIFRQCEIFSQILKL